MPKSQLDPTFTCSKEAVDGMDAEVSMLLEEDFTTANEHAESPLWAGSGQQSTSRLIQRFEILKPENFNDFPALAPKLHYTAKWRKLRRRPYQMRY